MSARPLPARPAGAGPIRRFLAGAGHLFQGLKLWSTSPRLMLLGAVPALLVGAVFATVVMIVVVNLSAIVTWLTAFADGWADPLRIALQIAMGVAVLGALALTMVFTFTAITLAIGDVFYERIWSHVERRLGDPPGERDEGWVAGAMRGLGNAVRLLLTSAAIGVALLLGGLIPLVGQTLVPVLAVLAGGWMLTVELCAYAFDARGFSLQARRHALAADRAGALGFGVATYVLFLVPLGAVLVMPAAVAGATVFSRGLLPGGGNQPTEGTGPA